MVVIIESCLHNDDLLVGMVDRIADLLPRHRVDDGVHRLHRLFILENKRRQLFAVNAAVLI